MGVMGSLNFGLTQFKFHSGTEWNLYYQVTCGINVAGSDEGSLAEPALIGSKTMEWEQHGGDIGCRWLHDGPWKVAGITGPCGIILESREWSVSTQLVVQLSLGCDADTGNAWASAVMAHKAHIVCVPGALYDVSNRNAYKPARTPDGFGGFITAYDILGKFGTLRAICAAADEWIRTGGWEKDPDHDPSLWDFSLS